MTRDQVRMGSESLKEFTREVFVRVGLPPEDAEIEADVLICELTFVVFVGEQVLNAGESSISRRIEALQEIDLVEHHGEVRCKSRHAGLQCFEG